MINPKIMFLDIETTPNLGTFWGPGKQYIGYESIWKEKKISCICWKWGGKSKIHELHMDLSKHDLLAYDDEADKDMLLKFSIEYNKADSVVAHNGIKFDKASIIARLSKHGLPPISPVIIDDTYLQSTTIKYNCHKLDYLARYFGLGKKANHPYELWLDVMRGRKKALRDTVEYCKKDVLLLERVFNRLKPYIKLKFNESIYHQDNRICPSCGGVSIINRKRLTAGLGLRLQMQCKACGKYFTTGENLVKKVSKYPRSL